MDSPAGSGGITFTASTGRNINNFSHSSASSPAFVVSGGRRQRARSSLSGRRHGICDAEAMGSLSLWPRIQETLSVSTELVPVEAVGIIGVDHGAEEEGGEDGRRRSSSGLMRRATLEMMLAEQRQEQERRRAAEREHWEDSDEWVEKAR